MNNRAALAAVFVGVSGSSLDDSTPTQVFDTVCAPCMELTAAGDAALVVQDADGRPRVVAASPDLVEVYDLVDVGALHDADMGAGLVTIALPDLPRPWKPVADAAGELGHAAVHVVPMERDGDHIGALHLFTATAAPLDHEVGATLRAIVQVAGISVERHRSLADARALAIQLQGALDSRVVIEQAKGIVAERLGIDVDDAFQALRSYARSQNARLADVSRATVDGEIDLSASAVAPAAPVR